MAQSCLIKERYQEKGHTHSIYSFRRQCNVDTLTTHSHPRMVNISKIFWCWKRCASVVWKVYLSGRDAGHFFFFFQDERVFIFTQSQKEKSPRTTKEEFKWFMLAFLNAIYVCIHHLKLEESMLIQSGATLKFNNSGWIHDGNSPCHLKRSSVAQHAVQCSVWALQPCGTEPCLVWFSPCGW